MSGEIVHRRTFAFDRRTTNEVKDERDDEEDEEKEQNDERPDERSFRHGSLTNVAKGVRTTFRSVEQIRRFTLEKANFQREKRKGSSPHEEL